MTSTPHATAGLAVSHNRLPALAGNITQPNGRPQRSTPLLRKIGVACLDDKGNINDFTRLVPAIAAFDDAFAALARGALIPTDRGSVAVEDLYPGDKVRTVDNGFQTLLWRGTTMIHPNAKGQSVEMGRLTRLAADALGIARPMHDLVLGPRARLVHRAPGIEALTGSDIAFVPVRDFIDAVNIIELTPPTPVEVYHLGFASHQRLLANGVEIESQHPGSVHALGLGQEMLATYLSCFPHMASFGAFGPVCLPRISLADLELFKVA